MVVRSTRESTEVAVLEAGEVRSTRESVEVATLQTATLRVTRMSVEVARRFPPSMRGHGRRIGMSFNRAQGDNL